MLALAIPGVFLGVSVALSLLSLRPVFLLCVLLCSCEIRQSPCDQQRHCVIDRVLITGNFTDLVSDQHCHCTWNLVDPQNSQVTIRVVQNGKPSPCSSHETNYTTSAIDQRPHTAPSRPLSTTRPHSHPPPHHHVPPRPTPGPSRGSH